MSYPWNAASQSTDETSLEDNLPTVIGLFDVAIINPKDSAIANSGIHWTLDRYTDEMPPTPRQWSIQLPTLLGDIGADSEPDLDPLDIDLVTFDNDFGLVDNPAVLSLSSAFVEGQKTNIEDPTNSPAQR